MALGADSTTRRNFSSARLRSVTSRITTAKPRRSPASSRNAEIPKYTQNLDPSLCRRQPSPSHRPSAIATASSDSGSPPWFAATGYRIEACRPRTSSVR